MQHIPANTRLTAVWPVSLQNQSGCRSISDDDLAPGADIFATVPASSACADCLYLTASGPHGAMKMAMRSPARHSC